MQYYEKQCNIARRPFLEFSTTLSLSCNTRTMGHFIWGNLTTAYWPLAYDSKVCKTWIRVPSGSISQSHPQPGLSILQIKFPTHGGFSHLKISKVPHMESIPFSNRKPHTWRSFSQNHFRAFSCLSTFHVQYYAYIQCMNVHRYSRTIFIKQLTSTFNMLGRKLTLHIDYENLL